MTSSIYVVVDRSAGEFESLRLGLSRSQKPARANASPSPRMVHGPQLRSYGESTPRTGGPRPPNGGTAFRFPPLGEDMKLAVGRWAGRLRYPEASGRGCWRPGHRAARPHGVVWVGRSVRSGWGGRPTLIKRLPQDGSASVPGRERAPGGAGRCAPGG